MRSYLTLTQYERDMLDITNDLDHVPWGYCGKCVTMVRDLGEWEPIYHEPIRAYPPVSDIDPRSVFFYEHELILDNIQIKW